ncbi:MAG: DUF5320 domain-containing protein [Smithella sp.]|nr:DUF5320 domain-containing protein [Smithella sp.]
MPRGDQTGPTGMGPMTGRGAGYCAGYATPGFASTAGGRGRGMGFGFGRGMGAGFRGARGGRGGRGFFGRWGMPFGAASQMTFAAPTREQEIDALQGQAKYFEDALSDVKKRLGELENQK